MNTFTITGRVALIVPPARDRAPHTVVIADSEGRGTAIETYIHCEVGQEVVATGVVQSREYNNRWYTAAKATSIGRVEQVVRGSEKPRGYAPANNAEHASEAKAAKKETTSDAIPF